LAAAVAVAVAAVVLAPPSCALVGVPPPHGLTGGERLEVIEDSSLLEIMGPGLGKDDHRKRYQGGLGPVLPAGADVQVTADYVQQRERMAPGAGMVDRNPWILVEVVGSPVPAQVGWRGWSHLRTLRRKQSTGGSGSGPATSPSATAAATVALGDATMAREARLCPFAGSDPAACGASLHAGTSVRVLACAGAQIRVELWTGDGRYTNGFVNASQVTGASCAAASKESP
jgi:hypothetical protein